MPGEIIFESLNDEEEKILLQAFGYDVDSQGYIIDENGEKMTSEEVPSKKLKTDNSALVPGSLKVIDASPTSLSKFLRQVEEG